METEETTVPAAAPSKWANIYGQAAQRITDAIDQRVQIVDSDQKIAALGGGKGGRKGGKDNRKRDGKSDGKDGKKKPEGANRSMYQIKNKEKYTLGSVKNEIMNIGNK